MKGIGGFLFLFLFFGLDPSNAKVFVDKPTRSLTHALHKKEQDRGSFSFQKSYAKSKSSSKNAKEELCPSLAVRGGVLLPTEPTAKVATLLAGLSNLQVLVLPEYNAQAFGLPRSPYLDFKQRFIGYGGLAHALVAGLLLFFPRIFSVPTAAVAGLLTMALPAAMSKDGHQQIVASGILGVVGSIVWLGMDDSSAQRVIIRGAARWGLVWNLGLAFVPTMEELFCSLATKQRLLPQEQGRQKQPEEDGKRSIAFFNRFLGCTNIGFFLFVYLVAGGTKASRAVGYSVAPSLVNLLIQNVVTHDVQHFGLDMGGQLFSIAFLGITILALTVQ